MAFVGCGLLAASAAASPSAHRLELGGGVAIPLSSEHRSIYGTGAAFTFGYAARISSGDSWFVLDVGLVRGAGAEYFPDPTFEMDDASYWLVPIHFGLRTNRRSQHVTVPGIVFHCRH